MQSEDLLRADLIFASTGGAFHQAKSRIGEICSNAMVVAVPRIFFSGFHPDVVYPNKASAERANPMGNANSAILLAAWRAGFSEIDTMSLFQAEVYEYLGYNELFPQSCDILIKECRTAGFDARPLLSNWLSKGAFMYQPLHPHLHVLADITHTLLAAIGVAADRTKADGLDDELARNVVWPIYPEIASILGVAGDYIFCPKNMMMKTRSDLIPFDLETFIVRSFKIYEQLPPDLTAFDRLNDNRYRNLKQFLKAPAVKATRSANPYRAMSPAHFWSKAVAAPEIADVDPVVGTKFKISPKDAIATAGSCFAQHISKQLQASGYNYLVTETAPKLDNGIDPRREDYGVFSARYGNIYTTRQLTQLVARAYGEFAPRNQAWTLDDGTLIDPFRPRIGNRSFGSLAELEAARERHFVAVRQMMQTLDVFVFTLGLTEAWQSSDDHAVVPLAPGVVGAQIDPSSYEPKNFSIDEIRTDLDHFVQRLFHINPGARILLTVSPVPLIATFEDEHVLAATIYSKSVLRVAAGEAARKYGNVDYFPSYEIVTGTFTRGGYFGPDLREVTEAGVSHVMKLFMRHYAGREISTDIRSAASSEALAGMEIVCDEEIVESNI